MVGFEDMAIGRVDRFGSIHVTREEVLDFARRYDPQPFHIDDAAAEASPLFGRLAASGWHTAAMAMRMTVDHWTSLGGRAMLGGAGVEDLKWLKPVYPGDTIRCEVEILDARRSASRPGVGIVRQLTKVFNQHDEPVMRHVSTIFMSSAEEK